MRRPDGPQRTSRRHVLRTLGASAAAGATLATAGCLSRLGLAGTEIEYAEITLPEPDEPTYQEWFPATTDDEQSLNLSINRYITPPAVTDDAVDGSSVLSVHEDLTRPYLDYVGVGFEQYDEVFEFGGVLVARGSFDVATVRETVLDMGYEQDDEYEGYERFSRPNPDVTLAVTDGTVVFERIDDGLLAAESVIDTGEGARERLVDVDDSFERLVDLVGVQPGILFNGESESGTEYGLDSDQRVAQGASISTYDEDNVYTQFVSVFDVEIEFAESDVKSYLEGGDTRDYESHRVDIAIDDEILTITTERSHEAFSEESYAGQPSPPQITWWYELEDGGDTLRITHRGGDAVDADELEVRYSHSVDEALQPDEQFADEYDRVEPGDSLTVDVSDRPADERLSIIPPTGGPNWGVVGGYDFDD